MIGAEFFLDQGQPATLTQRIIRVVLIMALCGTLLVLGSIELRRDWALADWATTPCLVINSNVESVGRGFDRESPYRVHVQYQYQGDTQPITKTEDANGAGTDEAAEAQGIARHYYPGALAVCYVNPRQSADSVLTRPSPLVAELFVSGLSFFTLALAIFYCIPQLFSHRSVSRSGIQPSRNALALISSICMCLGFGAALVWWYAIPLIEQLHTRSWPAVPATVLESNVLKTEGHGEYSITSYLSDIHYRYVYDGIEYHSNCFNLTEGHTLFGSARKRFTDRFPIGRQIVCFVNPADPSVAVLSRGISPGILNGFVLLTMIILGGTYALAWGNEARAKWFWKHNWRTLGVLGIALLMAAGWAQFASP